MIMNLKGSMSQSQPQVTTLFLSKSKQIYKPTDRTTVYNFCLVFVAERNCRDRSAVNDRIRT